MLLSALCHGLAWSHAGAGIDSIDVIRPAGTTLVRLESTVGYLREQTNQRFDWVCHESVTQPDAVITPRYVENGQGVILATIGDLAQAKNTSQALYWTDDGCSWNPATGLTDQQVSSVAFDPLDPSMAIAVTSNADKTNTLFRSTDSGRSWEPSVLAVEERVFGQIRFSRNVQPSVWTSTMRHETEEAWIHHSTDGGLSWTENAIDVRSADGLDVYVDVLIADATDPNTAWVVMGPFLDDRLLQTTDGGQSFIEVYTPDGDIIDGAQDADGSLWLVTTGSKVIRSETGEFFERVDAAPLSLGVEADEDRVLLATRIPSEGYGAAESTDGLTFVSIDTFGVLDGPPSCAPDTDSALYCDPLWPELETSIFGDSDTASPLAEDSGSPQQTSASQGCCSSESKHANAGLLVLIVLALGRRKESGTTASEPSD